MEERQISILQSKDPKQIKPLLAEFNQKQADLFTFTKFHENEQWVVLWRAVFQILSNEKLSSMHSLCLNTIRILTRDELSLQKHNISEDLKCLLRLAQLYRIETNVGVEITTEEETEGAAGGVPTAAVVNMEPTDAETLIVVEALKCLCNLVFQTQNVRRQCLKLNVTDMILKRVASPTQFDTAVELYDMKLLFLLTALEPEARTRVQLESNGIAYMTEWLHEKLCEHAKYSDEQLDVICEMLKVMFNITSHPDKSPSENESEIQTLHLINVMRELLLRFGDMNADKEQAVIANAVNLLTNIPKNCLTELLVKYCPLPTVEDKGHQVLEFEGYNVRALDVLLSYLHKMLNDQENAASSQEHIPATLTVLLKCVRCHPTMRHYVRKIILPPLKDVSKRPEVGHELRNHLCRFLTHPSMLRDLAAELLFVCCKENVGRMIKYTGYGNAAGLFANRGVLDCRRVNNTDYSSDSEDSDTEEYKQIQHAVNPVLGCYEPPKSNPLDGMSEQQKEYEAMQLVNLMDKLHKSGIVQPCRIGEDGKPQPVDHILQLQEELPQQQFEQKRKT